MPLSSNQIEDSFTSSNENVKTTVTSILNLNMHDENNGKLIVSNINKLLVSSKTRLQGLEFLNLILMNCPQLVLAENFACWLSYCTIQQHGHDILKELKLNTVAKIVECLHTNQDFNKKFVSEHLYKLHEHCLSCQTNLDEHDAALECLTVCMRHYPSWFGPHRAKIEPYFVKFLENSSDRLVEKASLAFLQLQQVGNAGSKGMLHKNNFTLQFHKLCSTAHNLFDTLLENVTEIDDVVRTNTETFTFNEVTQDSQNILHVHARRLTTCLQFIKTMIRKQFTVPKEIQPKQLLDLVSRGIAVHLCLDEENLSTETCHLSLLLNKIQVQLLQVLRLFILWYQRNALPFSYIISKVLIDCLHRCQNCGCFKSDCFYQEIVYKTFNHWLAIAKTSMHSRLQNQLLTCILKDITPVKNQITLTMTTSGNKSKSSKAKHKEIQARIIEKGQNSLNFVKATSMIKRNQEINCKFALATLRDILTFTTLKVNNKILLDMYNAVLNCLIEIQAGKVTHPYDQIDCQIALFEVLVAFYEQDCNVKILPPLQKTLAILNRGLASDNRKIVLVCEHGLTSLEKLCQPICPSLYMPYNSYVAKELYEPAEDIIDNVDTKPESVEDDEFPVEDINIDDEDATEVVEEQTSNDTASKVHIIDIKILRTGSEDAKSEKFRCKSEVISSETVNLNDARLEFVSVKSEHDSNLFEKTSKNCDEEIVNNGSAVLEKTSKNCDEEIVNNGSAVLEKTSKNCDEEIVNSESGVLEPPSKKFRSYFDVPEEFFEDDCFVDEVKDL